MTRLMLTFFIGLGLSSTVLAAEPTKTNTGTLSKTCYTTVGPLLQNADGKLTPEVRNAYLDWAEKTVLQQLRQSNQNVPADCLAEVRRADDLRVAIFGSVYPPDPSILQNYARLRAQLDAGLLANYRSLVIAISVARRTKGVESTADSKNIGHDYQPGFWTDESLQVPGSEEEKLFIRRIADFMEQQHVSALDLYQSESWQAQLRTNLTQNSIPSSRIAEVKKSVQFGELLKNAMILLGQRPAARDAKPDAIAWLSHLTRINTAHPSSTPLIDGKEMPWPLFPITTAPWPLLMPLAHSVPLSEADHIWETFQGQHGPDRYHTYGPYRGDDDVVPDSLRPSRWFWDAWPDRIVHGGMCVPISKGTVDLYSALGKPAMWAGQPGHANLISFQYVDGAWTAEIEQAFAGGPDVTTAQWYFDEDPGTMLRFRDLYYWPGAEYQLGLAVGMNVGVKSYLDTRIAANIFRALPTTEKRSIGVKLLRSALQDNPFNPDLWYRLAEQTSNAQEGLTLAEAASKGNPGLLLNTPGTAYLAKSGAGPASDQYWHTLARFVTQYSLLSQPAPRTEKGMQRIYTFLNTVPSISADDLASYLDKYESNPTTVTEATSALQYDQSLAKQGDAYGQLRMGQRYRDGNGVPLDEQKAQDLFAASASQGNGVAAHLLANRNPSIPAGMITVTASSTGSPMQSEQHLIDGSGMVGAMHDNAEAAQTMWHTADRGNPAPPAPGLAASPAWVRFDFTQPIKFDSVLIWNHNQEKLTDRGFRKTRLYGSSDGTNWIPLTDQTNIELPCASGAPFALPSVIPNSASSQLLKSVIIAADTSDGNYGGACYGLSAVRFVAHRLPNVIPQDAVTVTASATASTMQSEQHLIDGSGMIGIVHDNAEAAQTMWHTPGKEGAKPPAPGLASSPGWVRFDLARPAKIGSLLIWNHNQAGLTDRGLRKIRIYASVDGTTWRSLTASQIVELPRAPGNSFAEPTSVSNLLPDQALKAIIIAAEPTEGNYGGACYGLSAVRFVIAHKGGTGSVSK